MTTTVVTVPPMTMLVSGPKVSASMPTTGAPSGATPMKTSRYMLITRPRICGSTLSWNVALSVVT